MTHAGRSRALLESLPAEADIEPLRLPGGLDRIEIGARLEGVEGGADDLRPGQHVAGDGDLAIRALPAPGDAVPAGPGSRAAHAVDGMHLAQMPAFIGAERAFYCLGWR